MSNYTRLTASSMRTISSHWLKDPEARALLEKHAKTSALLPDIQEAHEALVSSLGGDDTATLEAQIAKLREQGATIDSRHDRKYRGTWKLFDALIELSDSQETADVLIALRNRLQPAGLIQVNASWADEAGNAATIRAQLDKETRKKLKDISSIDGRTLDDEVQAWIKAGEELGPVATRKAALEHELAHPDTPADSAATRQARLDWIRAVRALESNIDLIKGMTGQERGLLLGLLHQTTANAERNAARRKGAPDAPEGSDTNEILF